MSVFLCVSFRRYTHVVRSGPNFAHTCRFISNGSELNKNQPCVRGVWVVLGGQKFKNLEYLQNGRTNWHQIWYTPADSSGNGHRLKTISPSIPQGAFVGVLRGQKFNNLE